MFFKYKNQILKLLGEPPWCEFKSPMNVLVQLYNIKEPPNIPDSLSNDLKDFISCCLKIEPKERLNVYELLRHPFITGDVFTFHNVGNLNYHEKNNEFENKFFSEERNTRCYMNFYYLLFLNKKKLIYNLIIFLGFMTHLNLHLQIILIF